MLIIPNPEKKDNAYYWEHPREYRRLKDEDLKYEPTVYLCEYILSGLRKEMENVIKMVTYFPNDIDCRHNAVVMKHDLERPFIDALTFGHGSELVDELVRRCPKGVFDEDEGSRTNEKMAGGERYNPEANVNSLRYKRIASEFNRRRGSNTP